MQALLTLPGTVIVCTATALSVADGEMMAAKPVTPWPPLTLIASEPKVPAPVHGAALTDMGLAGPPGINANTPMANAAANGNNFQDNFIDRTSTRNYAR